MTKEDKMRRLNNKIMVYKHINLYLNDYVRAYPDDLDMSTIYQTLLFYQYNVEKEQREFTAEILKSPQPMAGPDSVRPDQENWSTPPQKKLSNCGKLITELMKKQQKTFTEVCNYLSLLPSELDFILQGKLNINSYVADKLESLFHIPAHYWWATDLIDHLDKEKEV